MFNMSLYLLHYMLNFVFKSATEFISRRKRNSKKYRHHHYEVARSSSFKADYKLSDDTGITFIPPVFVQRYHVASDIIKQEVAHSSKLLKVIDFGCAEVSYFEHLRRIDGLEKVLCIDVDEDMLQRYHKRAKPLNYNHICPRGAPFSVDIFAGSIADCDPCLLQTDIVVCIELIEHLYPHELNAVPWTIFGYTQPKVAVFTTPNVEFNVMFKGLNGFRHDDHKFEWTRKEFEDWAENIILRFPNYEVKFSGIGPGPVGTEHLGCVSQMAVFTRKDSLNTEAASIEAVPSYKLIESYEYPFFIDTRTDTEKIRDEVTHHRIRLAYLEPYVDQDVPRIELSLLLKFVDQYCQSIEELKTVLESFGSVIEVNENGDLCVVGMEDDRSEGEEGYLTGDGDTENAYSDWGTYRNLDEWPASPAWDATAVTNADWDAWDEPAPSQNCPPCHDDQSSEESMAPSDLEISHIKMAESNSSVLTSKDHNLEETHHLNDISITQQLKKNCNKTKPSELEIPLVSEIKCSVKGKTNPNMLSRENVSLEETHQLTDMPHASQNKMHFTEKKPVALNVLPVIELNYTQKIESNSSMLTQKNGSVKTSHDTNVLNTSQLDRNNSDTKPPVTIIDLADAEFEMTCDRAKSKQPNLSSVGTDENGTTEGVWVISEELRYSKPHRRKYRKYKKRKFFESEGCENNDSNISGEKFAKKRNIRSKRGDHYPKNPHVFNPHEPSNSTSCARNEEGPNFSTANAFFTEEVKRFYSNNRNEDDCNDKTNPKSSHADHDEKNLTTVFSNSVNNRRQKSKSGRGGKRGGKRSTLNGPEMTSFTDQTSQASGYTVQNETLNNNSNQINSNPAGIHIHEVQSTPYQNKFFHNSSRQAQKRTRNNNRVLQPKKLNQNNNLSKIKSEDVNRNPSVGNPFLSTFLKLCDETNSSQSKTSQDCLRSEKNFTNSSL